MKRILFIILFLGSICFPANEVQIAYTSGSTLYFRIFNSTGQVWNTSGTPAFEAWADGNVTDYDIAFSDTDGAFYLGAFPAIDDGTYSVVAYLQSGANPATDDDVLSSNIMKWEDDAEITTLPANVTQWLGTACATPTTAGVPEVDITYINGDATNGYNATLKLKALDISNNSGNGISVSGNPIGAYFSGSTYGAYFSGDAVGAYFGGDDYGAYFSGYIKDIDAGEIDALATAANAIYNNIDRRESSSLETLMQSVVANYKMNDNTDTTTILDSSANGYNGNSVRETSIIHTDGKIGGALTFNGSSDNIICTIPDSVFKSDFSMNFWCKPIIPEAQDYFLFFGTSALGDGFLFELDLNSNRLLTDYIISPSTADIALTTDLFTAGVMDWLVLSVVVSQSGAKINTKVFYNGEFLVERTSTADMSMSDFNTGNSVSYIGGTDADNFFGGLFDNFIIFNKALSAEEVKLLYTPSIAISELREQAKTEVNAECDTAISDAALATAANLATVDTVVDAIKAKTDNLPADTNSVLTTIPKVPSKPSF